MIQYLPIPLKVLRYMNLTLKATIRYLMISQNLLRYDMIPIYKAMIWYMTILLNMPEYEFDF